MVTALSVSTITSCVYYHPVPAAQPRPSKLDRSWDAALAAADDVGVVITATDRVRGTIEGHKGVSNVTITLWQQADGSVRVGFNVRAPTGPDADLADHLSHAFDRRMY
jgi:hypothetical protein